MLAAAAAAVVIFGTGQSATPTADPAVTLEDMLLAEELESHASLEQAVAVTFTNASF